MLVPLLSAQSKSLSKALSRRQQPYLSTLRTSECNPSQVVPTATHGHLETQQNQRIQTIA